MHHLLLLDRAQLTAAGSAPFPFWDGIRLWRLIRPASPVAASVSDVSVGQARGREG